MITTDTEFLKAAFKSYDNPSISSVSEFDADTKRFIYLNTTINRFLIDSDETRLRVALNHIVIITNCFGVETAVQMLRYKSTEETLVIIETMMYFLRMVNETKSNINFDILKRLTNL